MKAVILAAGEGRRLRPLTETRPKPMLPAGNRPLLEHIVEAVIDAGIDEIVLVVGYRKERIQSHFGDGDDWDVGLTYVEQAPQLGTGDALLQAEPLVGADFVALNGDRIIDPDLIRDVVDLRSETGDVVMAVTEMAHPERYGVVEVEDGLVTAIQERPPAEFARSNLINAGVYGFGPSIFAALRKVNAHGELGITAAIERHFADQPVRACNYGGSWLDVSTPWDLLDVNGTVIDRSPTDVPASATVDDAAVVADAAVLDANATVGPNAAVLRGSAVGKNATVGANAVLMDTIVLPDASIRPGVMLNRCIVGANTSIGSATVVEGGPATVVLEDTVHRDVELGGVVGDNSSIGANVTIRSGTIAGNDVTVDGGTVLDGQIDSGSAVRGG